MTTIASLKAVFTADDSNFKAKANAVKAHLKELQAAQKQNAMLQKDLDKQDAARLKSQQKQMASFAAVQKQKAQEMAKNMAPLSTALDKFTGKFSLAQAAFVGTVAVAGKKIYEFGKQGAQIEYTAIKFDRLARAAGSTGDVFLNDLRRATRGTISDFSAMQLGANVLQLGLAKNTKEAGRLATVMTALGMDVGEVTLAIANQSTRRLDQLGLSLIRFNENKKKILAEGGNLTKEQVFTEAFLRTAEQTVATTGNMADTRLGNFQRYEANVENIKNEGKLLISEALAPTMQGVAQFMSGISDLIQGRRVWDFNQNNGMWTRELPAWATNESVQQRMSTMGFTQSGFGAGSRQAEQAARAQLVTEARNRFYQTQAAQMGTATEQGMQIPIDYKTLVSGALQFAEVNQKVVASKEQLNAQLSIEQAKLVELQNAYGANTEKVIEQAGVVAQLEQQRIELAQSYKDSANDMMLGLIATAAGEEMAAEKQLDFAMATGQVTKEAYAQQKAMMEIANQFAAGTMNADQAAAATLRVIEYLQMLDGMSVEAYINLVTTGNMPYGGGGQTVGGSGPANRPGTPPIKMEASGGAFSGWAITGDSAAGLTPHSELVYAPHGAYVYNASQTRSLLASGMGGVDRFASGGAIMLDGVTNITPLNGVNWGLPTINKPKPADNSTDYVSNSTVGTVVQATAEIVTSAMETMAESITEPIVFGVSSITERANLNLKIEVNKMTAETKKTNDLLAAIFSKTASEGGIARAVIGQGNKWNG